MTRNLPEDLNINDNDLSYELGQQPGLQEYWSTIAVNASLALDRCKSEMETVETTIAHEIRERARRMGDRITEKEIVTLTTLDPRVQGKKKELLDCKERKAHTAIAAKAMEQKMSAMISMAALERAKMSSIDPTFRVDDVTRQLQQQRQQEASKARPSGFHGKPRS